MARVVATFPGKIGDLFMQWPVTRWYAKKNGPIDLGIPPFMAGVSFLMAQQEHVDGVYFTEESVLRSWKRDPPPYGIEDKPWRRWEKQLEMGFRDVPDTQLTLYIAKTMHLDIPKGDLAEPSIYVGERNVANYAVVNGTFLSQTGESPPFWAALGNWYQYILKEFDKIYFVGSVSEMRAVKASDLPFEIFDDGGNLLLTAQLMRDARIVVGSSSAIAALGSAMGVPTIRVHDPIPGFDKSIWDSLLPNQLNYEMQPGDGVEVLKGFMETWC
jgi:hypothetical protein